MPARHSPVLDLFRLVAVAAALLTCFSCSSPSSNTPPASRQLTITFSGRFDISNLLRPQRTPHSYTYGISWKYTWNGSWEQLFGAGNSSGQVPFQVVDITGNVDATYRDTVDGPDVRCTISLLADSASPPNFTASYDSSQRTVRVTNAEAPTFRYTTSQSADPKCAGGPGVNIFSQPSDWNPLGNGGGTVSSNGGKQDYEKRWQWTHTFAGGEVRTYDATGRSTLELAVR